MKKVLLLGALLSTMAFGAAGNFTHKDSTPTEATISLKGTAIEQVKIISGTEDAIEFGTVVIGAKKLETREIGLSGTGTYNVSLTATVTGTNSNVLDIAFGDTVSDGAGQSASTKVALSGGTGTAKIAIQYAPTGTGHSLTNGEIINLTATYTD